MNHKTIITELRRINAWRRGDETVGQPAPGHFGDVLDAAAESLASLIASNTTLWRAREALKDRCIEREERIEQMGASWDKTKADLARVTAERDEARAGRMELERFRDRYEPVRQSLIKQEAELAALRARVTEVEVKAERYRLVTLRQDADLARVTAEREAEFRRSDSELAAAAQKESSLRARVAELDESLHLTNGTADLALHHRDIAEQRNAELEAALREAAQTITAIRAVNVTEFGTVSDAAIDRLCRSDNTADTLARAESATPAKHTDTERLDWLCSDTEAANYFLTESIHAHSPDCLRDALDAALDSGKGAAA